jgi:predicted alpha/beta-fold hydrolase
VTRPATAREPTAPRSGLDAPPGAPFRPAWWCPGAHLQTIWGPLFRRAAVPLRRERLPTPDGDFVDLDWADGDGLGPGAPHLLVLHGLEGSSRSHYVTGLVRVGRGAGWRGVALNFRSCSGELNRLPRFYHSGETGDLDHVVRTLVRREPGVPVGIVGVSLGGNVLLKWLGELGGAAPAELVGAVGVSVPFDLAACARVLDRGARHVVYGASFLRTMRRKVRAKARMLPGFVDVAAAGRARTFAAYDGVVTAPLGGFRDALDYWTRASCGPYLAHIRRPTLLLSALDDPIVPAHTLPDLAGLPGAVRAEFVRRGGHAGFLEGRWPWRAGSWAERRAVEYLTSRLRA